MNAPHFSMPEGMRCYILILEMYFIMIYLQPCPFFSPGWAGIRKYKARLYEIHWRDQIIELNIAQFHIKYTL